MKLCVHMQYCNTLHYTVHVCKYLHIHCVCEGGGLGVVFLSINVNFCTCVLTFAVKTRNSYSVSLQQTTHFFFGYYIDQNCF